jgi:hypothetical protein
MPTFLETKAILDANGIKYPSNPTWDDLIYPYLAWKLSILDERDCLESGPWLRIYDVTAGADNGVYTITSGKWEDN